MIGRPKNDTPITGNMAFILKRNAERILARRARGEKKVEKDIEEEYNVILDF